MAPDDGRKDPEVESMPDADPYASGAYEYRDSQLREHHGHVPSWLWIVTLGLIVWGVYYVVVYWNAPHPVIY
jgi:hypothetical protein